MQNSDIVKKRLSELKKLSQNLKQTTQLKSDLDVSLIKAILSITKTNNITNNSAGLSTPGIHSLSNLSIHKSPSSPNMKSISTSLLHKFVNKTSIVDQSKNEQYIQPLFQQTQRSMKDQIQSKKTFNKNNSFHTSQSKFDTDELIHLREDNVKMQLQIRELKEKLVEYKNKQEQERHKVIRQKQKRQDYSDDEGVGHSPYFRLNQQIQLFVTEINVNKSDYKKIQHSIYPLKLTLDKLTIKKQKKSNSASKSKLMQQEYSFVELEMVRIKDVVYIQNNRMLLVFKNHTSNQQTHQYLFLQFDTPETLHRWDLAIYINYKIVTSLNKENIFRLQFTHKVQENTQITQKKEQKQKEMQVETLRYSEPDIFTQNYKEQQKQFLKLYLQNKRKYVQSQKNLKQEMLQKINHIKNQNQEQFRPLSFNVRNSKEAIQIKLEDHFQNIVKQNQLSKQKQREIHKDHLEVEPVEQKHFKQDENAKAIQKTQLNRISEKQQKSQIEPEMIVKQLQLMLISKQKQEQNKKKNQQKKRVNDATNLLKSGRLMMKYSKSAFNPHQKRVFVSQDNTRLCWQDKDSNEFKFIYISDIQSINKGELGPGLQKHLEGKKINNPSCYVTIHTKIKDRKTLEFGIKSFALMEQFIDCLLILITQLRKGRL